MGMAWRIVRRARWGVAAVLAACGWAGAQPAGEPTESRYVRALDSEDGSQRLLQVSVRTMAPREGDGPLVHLVGVVHIGEKAYYAELQRFLDAQSVVLYEGVKPEGEGDAPRDNDAKARITAARQRMLAILVSRYRRSENALPPTLDAAVEKVGGSLAKAARAALRDAWGNPQHLVLITDPASGRQRFDIVSHGSDGAPGGEGPAADIAFSAQKPLRRAEVDAAGDGIQAQLARALGLEFQLSAIDYARTNWRNSDLSIDEVSERLGGGGENAEPLFQLLDGSSTMARMASLVLGFIERDASMSAMVRLMMIETLAQAESLMGAMPGEMNDFMRVIIVDRNQAVLDDLRRLLDTEKGHESVALFYGAGHLPDLEEAMVRDFAYEHRETRWFTGMRVAYDDAGGKDQADSMREMLRTMMGQMQGR